MTAPANANAEAAGMDLLNEGEAITEALARADALCAFIVESAMVQHVPITRIDFDPHAAARIAHMACQYRDARAGEGRK